MSTMIELAIKIADSCAASDIESNCPWVTDDDEGVAGEVPRESGQWYNTARAIDGLGGTLDADDQEWLADSLAYLEARGLLMRKEGAPHLVRIREDAPVNVVQSETKPPTLPFEVAQLRETAKSFRASGDQGSAHLMERSADLLEMASMVAAAPFVHQVVNHFDPTAAWNAFLDTEDGRVALTVSTEWRNRFYKAFSAGYYAAPQPTETFWVVEHFEDGRSTGYWDGGSSRSFVPDIHEAVQFCRKQDAFRVTRGWHWTDTQLTEHAWLPKADLRTVAGKKS